MFRLAAPTLRSNARPVSAFKAAPLVRAAAPTLTKYVEGTVNDPIPFPAPNKSHGSYHWTFERALSAALVPLIAGTAVSSVNPIYDGILSVAIVAHSHMGFDQLLTDYLHPRKFPTIGPIMIWLLRAATGGVLVGIYQFNTNDIGLTELVKKVWTA
ncbi:succinate dehydrogenase (ubiquinone) membrane anchor subunit [Pseudohyphozyma bogoriensis]|nr:succinate dehydrogenase (ubiquinone) membrane anchor subunit [Pseudohyphozyma bogoriensis]